MKALPLWQPWASLVVHGAKRIETRAYPPRRLGLSFGDRIAIHACKTGLPKEDEMHLLGQAVFQGALQRPLGLEPFMGRYDIFKALPRGAIIGSVTLVRASEVTADKAHELERTNPAEHWFGDYTPGRWAWVLADPRPLPAPIQCKGHQGTFDVPEAIAAVLGEPERAEPLFS